LKLWEQGHLKKANLAWNNGAAVSTAGTTKLRAAVAVTIKARCILPMTDTRRIKTARDLVIEIMKEVIAYQEAFQSSRDVYLEMADNHKLAPRDQYPAEKKQKTDHAPAGAGGGQGAPKGGSQGAPKGERYACPCGKTHAGGCWTNGVPASVAPTNNSKPSLGMQLNRSNTTPKLRALKSGKRGLKKLRKTQDPKGYNADQYKPKGQGQG
jgi:hypothetical protein